MLGGATHPDRMVTFDVGEAPKLIVYVDGEEEFPWSSFSRSATSVRNIAAQYRGQDIFCQFGIRPTYLVDYPVASQEEGIRPLSDLVSEGQCTIGSQLHAWVTPPLLEEVTARNTFAGNLSEELVRAKIGTLTQVITANFGTPPRTFKAGRYGTASYMPKILKEYGYLIDASVLPLADFSPQGGPDHTHAAAQPYWIDPERELLEIPVTAGLVGLLNEVGPRGTRIAFHPVTTWMRFPALLSRLGLLERVRLTPEGMSLDEAMRLTLALMRRGQRLFVLSYHSSSLLPGGTPYVGNDAELRAFLRWIQEYCRFFFGSLGGQATTPEIIYEKARKQIADDGGMYGAADSA